MHHCWCLQICHQIQLRERTKRDENKIREKGFNAKRNNETKSTSSFFVRTFHFFFIIPFFSCSLFWINRNLPVFILFTRHMRISLNGMKWSNCFVSFFFICFETLRVQHFPHSNIKNEKEERKYFQCVRENEYFIWCVVSHVAIMTKKTRFDFSLQVYILLEIESGVTSLILHENECVKEATSLWYTVTFISFLFGDLANIVFFQFFVWVQMH